MRLGFIGAGAIAAVHAEALKSLHRADIVAWSSRRAESAQKRAQQFGGEPMPLDAMLARRDIDAVVICSPTHLHLEHVRAAVQADKKVFCEKPLARTLTDCEEIIRLGEGRVYVGHVLRFFHAYQQAHEIVRRGDLGQVRRVACHRLNGIPEGSQNWFLDFEKSGGVILDLIIHDFDWLLWTFGEPDDIRVEVETQKDPQGIRHALVHWHWNDGKQATVEGSWLHDGFEQRFRIDGAEGYIESRPGERPELVIARGEAEKHMPLRGLPDPYALQMLHFLDWLAGRHRPRVSLQEATRAVAVALKAIEHLPNA